MLRYETNIYIQYTHQIKKEEVKITINILEFEFITTKKRRTEHHVCRASIVVVN